MQNRDSQINDRTTPYDQGQQDMFLLAGVMKNLVFKGHVPNVTTNLKGGPILNVLCTHEAKFPIYDEAQTVHKTQQMIFQKIQKVLNPEAEQIFTFDSRHIQQNAHEK